MNLRAVFVPIGLGSFGHGPFALRPLALCALVAAGTALGCTPLLEEGCEATLTCEDSAAPYLDENCRWRLSDGTLWAAGPQPNDRGVWLWPDGKLSLTQSFVCRQQPTARNDASVGSQPVVKTDSSAASTEQALDGGSDASGLMSMAGAGDLTDAGSIADAGPIADASSIADASPIADAGADSGGLLSAGDCQPQQVRRCDLSANLGSCSFGSQTCVNGSWGPCQQTVQPANRDCTSPLDNDCDGLPDNTVDSVCQCVVGTSLACDTHPGLDGIGSCRAGRRTCQASFNNQGSRYSSCQGSVAPLSEDECVLLGDDADCNGIANQGCECIAALGNLGCLDADAPRCDPWGYCEPCNSSADCTLITGLPRCVAGQCVL